MHQNFDPRKNVLQGILHAAKKGMAHGMKAKYAAPTPNLEAGSKQPVPGAEAPGEEMSEDQMHQMLEQMAGTEGTPGDDPNKPKFKPKPR